MATIIDALLVTLGLDAAGMTSGAKEAATAYEKIKKDAADAADALKKQQEIAREELAKTLKAEIAAGKITKDEAKQRTDALKKKQREEADALKKANREKIDSSKKEASEKKKNAQAAEQQAKQVAGSVSKARNEVLGLIAAFAGFTAMKAFGVDLTHANVEAGRLSKTLDIEPKFLRAFEGAADALGASKEDADDILRNVTKTGENLKNGIMPSQDELSAFGIAANKANAAGAHVNIGKYWDPGTDAITRMKMLNDLASHLSGKERANLLGQLGFSESQSRVLGTDPGKLDAEIEKMKDLQHVTDAQIESETKMNQKWVELREKLSGVGNEILNHLDPTIEKFQSLIGRVLDYADKHLGQTELAVGALVAVTIAFGAKSVLSILGFVSNMGKATAAVEGTTAAIAGEKGLLGTLTGLAGKVFKFFIVADIAHEVVKSIDPEDKMGTWIDEHIWGASAVDNFASKFGFGRSYKEQAEAAGREYKDNEENPTQDITQSAGHFMPPGKNYDQGSYADYAAIAKEGKNTSDGSNEDYGNSRGMRNNNPGNLNFANQAGATKEVGEKGRFAVFSTMDQGLAALGRQLKLYQSRGNDTVGKIISIYAPPTDKNDTAAYINYVSKSLGVKSTDKIDLNNPAVLSTFIHAIISKENNEKVANKLIPKINKSVGNIALPSIDPAITKALQPGPPIDRGITSGAAAAINTSNVTNHGGATTNNNIKSDFGGTINIHTPATDSKGIASDIGKNLQSYIFASNANKGLV